jgi:hypothetical protein
MLRSTSSGVAFRLLLLVLIQVPELIQQLRLSLSVASLP